MAVEIAVPARAKTEEDRLFERLRATRDAAVAFAEDRDFIRQLLAQTDPVPADIRRSSAIARRLLIDGDLGRISPPRIGKLLLRTFDNRVVYKINSEDIGLFVSGGISAFGVSSRMFALMTNDATRRMNVASPDAVAHVDLTSFIKQRVICCAGIWATRADVIRYVANVLSGVHSGQAKSAQDVALGRSRNVLRYSLAADMPTMDVNMQGIRDPAFERPYDGKALDPPLIEIMATLTCLRDSPALDALEAAIRSEVSR